MAFERENGAVRARAKEKSSRKRCPGGTAAEHPKPTTQAHHPLVSSKHAHKPAICKEAVLAIG